MEKLVMKQSDGAAKTGSVFKRWFFRSRQWLYRGGRPGGIAKIMNRAYATAAAWGIGIHGLVALEVIGRKSGKTVSFPLVLVKMNGQRYLVSMLGNHAQWVRNVQAAGGKAVLHSGGREAVQLEEIPAEQRAPILKAYLQLAPGARPHVTVDKNAPLKDFEKIAAAYPVFRLISDRAS